MILCLSFFLILSSLAPPCMLSKVKQEDTSNAAAVEPDSK